MRHASPQHSVTNRPPATLYNGHLLESLFLMRVKSCTYTVSFGRALAREKGINMYQLKVKGMRNSTLAYHRFESYADLLELVAVYRALGHKPEALLIEEIAVEQAA
jgi:hypothetical protein